MARRDDDIALTPKHLLDERQFRLLARIQQVVPFGLDAIAIQLLIRSHAPHVRRYAIFGQQTLRFGNFIQNRAATLNLTNRAEQSRFSLSPPNVRLAV